MLDLKKPRAWAGSLVFVVAISAMALAVLWVLAATSGPHPNVSHIVVCAVIVALVMEGIRRAKLAELRRDLAKADDRAVMRVTLNGIDMGEVPEPLFVNMKLVTANDARNYVAQFYTILRAFWRHAVYTLAVTIALLFGYFAWKGLVAPADLARAALDLVASTEAHADPVQRLADRLHLIASSVVSIYAMFYMLLGCMRLTFGASLSISNAFHEDFQRRLRLILGTPAAGVMSFHRVRTA
ncbi:hypothetical protein [Paraburkholderia sp. J8-2]|uniref:hypothetical protein n=1 Tax=Paraburkholderia sp. J8-2 TaxID=2805440 RepID=UPI002AB71B79|nr:hypothetical protein [Paraburkholderia sp. J8-2]